MKRILLFGSFWVVLFLLPAVWNINGFTPVPLKRKTFDDDDNDIHQSSNAIMKRAKRSFTNLFKMLSAKNMSSSSAESSNSLLGDSGHLLKTYRLSTKLCLTVAQGSVVDFRSKKAGAIVNAANEGCLGGGGVDGAITSAGGMNLADDRLALPRLRGDIRCFTGDAKITGPGNYGSLRVPYVIHSVGPNYMFFDEEFDVETPHRLLRSAYQKALDCTLETPIEKVAFSLLSAGVFRGDQSLETVLGIGVKAIRDWSVNETNLEQSVLEDVVMYAFTDREAKTLVHVCNHILGEGNSITGPPPELSDDEGEEADSESGDDEVEKSKEEDNAMDTDTEEQPKDAEDKDALEAKREPEAKKADGADKPPVPESPGKNNARDDKDQKLPATDSK